MANEWWSSMSDDWERKGAMATTTGGASSGGSWLTRELSAIETSSGKGEAEADDHSEVTARLR